MVTSVSRLLRAGMRGHLELGNCFMENLRTGERLDMRLASNHLEADVNLDEAQVAAVDADGGETTAPGSDVEAEPATDHERESDSGAAVAAAPDDAGRPPDRIPTVPS